MNTRAVQARDFILDPQLTTLQLIQLEIISGWMLQRFRQFRFQHLVTLFEFRELRQYCHSLVSLGSERIPDHAFVAPARAQVDVTKPLLHCNEGIKIPNGSGLFA